MTKVLCYTLAPRKYLATLKHKIKYIFGTGERKLCDCFGYMFSVTLSFWFAKPLIEIS